MALNNPNGSSGVNNYKNCTPTQIQLKAGIANACLKNNDNRAYLVVQNNNSIAITLILGGTNNASVGQGLVLNPKGGSYEINSNNLYIGAISAIAPMDCKLNLVECDW
jgi:hypothetical protein